MSRRNLGPHMCCSHMIEPLGARWCLGMCDVTHCNLLLCNLTSVLTSNPSQEYRVNERLVLNEKNDHKTAVALCVSQTHVCVHHTHASHGEHHSRASLLCIMMYASLSRHHGKCIMSYAPFYFVHGTSHHGITLALHWYKWTYFTTSIMQSIQIINSEQGCSKHHS